MCQVFSILTFILHEGIHYIGMYKAIVSLVFPHVVPPHFQVSRYWVTSAKQETGKSQAKRKGDKVL